MKCAFSDTLLGLTYLPINEGRNDLFTQACIEQYCAADYTDYGYLFAQVFEPNVLLEVCILADLDYYGVVGLAHRPTSAMRELAERFDNRVELPIVGLVNLAAALISISRFEPAERVLAEACIRACSPRDTFEIAMLKFIVSNRTSDGTGSAEAFNMMRTAIEARGVPDSRILEACAQAVVWYLKRQEIPEECFKWYVTLGKYLVSEKKRLDSGSLSAWYRAIAMLPAAAGDSRATRLYMEKARDAARETISRRPRAYEQHLIKTYHESTIKEHMYVTRDFAAAEKSALDLIELDPFWSPSYAEAAEMYIAFRQPERAIDYYDRALELGPPYHCHNLLRAAKVNEKCRRTEWAVELYTRLAGLVKGDEQILRAGSSLANSIAHESEQFFADELAALPGGNQAGRTKSA